MKIRKKEPSVGVLGKIVNSFSSSKNDTYSADYLNTMQDNIESAINLVGDICKAGLNGDYTCIGGSEEKIPFTQKIYSTNNNLTVTSDGGIKIGAGINTVLVTAQAYFYTGSVGDKTVNIIRNTEVVTRTNYKNCGLYNHLSCPSTAFLVSEGDIIYFTYFGNSGDVLKDYTHGSSLQVTVLN